MDQITAEPNSLVNPKRDAQGEITEPAPELQEGEAFHGYAWGMETLGGLWGRTGQLPGTMTASYIEPKTGLTIVVALNNTGGKSAIARHSAFAIAAGVAEEAGAELQLNYDAEIESMNKYTICAG